MKIKFRAWHKQDEYMILPEQCERFEINFTPKGYDGFSFRIEFKGGGGVLGSSEHIELMQYAGIKDKNGKEIFEGDIIKCEVYSHEQYQEFLSLNPVEIKYSNGSFYPFGYNSGWRSSVDEVEVIGNKFENKELLK